jgi:hypothetical protein
VDKLIPVSVAESGNVAVNFVALSYAGSLIVTIVAEPDLVPTSRNSRRCCRPNWMP